jgi:nickel-dependent lactate racemase
MKRIAWGREQLELELREYNLVVAERAPIQANLVDPVQSLRDALEHPLDYPALRLALTPEDHVAIAVDERVPYLGRLLVPLLEHIGQARVPAEAITLICAPPSSGQPWLDELPDVFQDVRVEVHQPDDRKKLAYLATTKSNRRVYLNRTAVDADQLILLTRRTYDPRVGHGGAETALYPWLGDEATREEFGTQFDSEPPVGETWPVQQEAREVAWLLGAPFFVQVIEGDGDGIAHIVTGPLESSPGAERLLDARWRVEVAQLADVVIASITGDAVTLDDVARAFFAGARVVKPGGSIVVLTDAAPVLGPGFERLRQHDDPALALRQLFEEKPSDLAAAFMWGTAAEQAKLYLLSGLAQDVAEELFTIPMQNAQQAQKLLTESATCLLLPDAHRTLAVLR